MAEDIKNLIEKINEEGVKAAEKKAQEIESKASERAEEILEKAREEAASLITDAKEELSQMQAKQEALLSQAGRDLLLSLRKEINAMLERIVVSDIRQAQVPEMLLKMIVEAVKGHSSRQPKADIVVAMKKEDLDVLEKNYLVRLKEEAMSGVTLKPSEGIHWGFTISFDSGKSCYDFTDKALADYIGQHLKPKLNALLTSAVSEH